MVAATSEELREQWPVYAQQLAERTPFCSVLSLPVGGPLAVWWRWTSTGPGRAAGEDVLRAVVEVAGAVGEALTGDLAGDEAMRLGLPAVLRTPAIDARHRVWLAISASSPGPRASRAARRLARLRALAFRHGVDVETAADRLLSGEVEVPDP